MLKRTITYNDYNGVSRTEDFYFNLSESEIAEMELSTAGGMAQMLQNIINAQDLPSLVKIFKDLLFRAYGEKSPDGRRFIKDPALSKAFSETEAYNKLFMELATDHQKASDFINQVLPQIPDELKKRPDNISMIPENTDTNN